MGTGDSELTIDVRRDGDRAVVAVAGELDIASVARLGEALRSVDDAAATVLDLRELRFLDTSGLRAVIEEHRRAETEGRALTIRRGPASVQRVFELAGVHDRLPFVDGES